MDMQDLHRFIVDSYDLEELRTLCFNLGVNYDALPSEGTAAKARELVLYLRRQRQLDELLDALRWGRPEAFDEVGLSKITVEMLYDALPVWEESTTPPGQRALDAKGAQIGVIGDHTRVEGGIHFHTARSQEENLRDKELAYLDSLLKRYAYWEQHYTPLAGIVEVRAAVKDGPRLDLPMPFIPPGFEKLVEHDYGDRYKIEIERVPVDDIRQAVVEHRRIILLGDPGSGKTTTLWRLAYDYAQAAREDKDAPLPAFVSLGSYTDASPFDAYLTHHLGPLGEHLETYFAAGRLALLLDGLNEMPREGYARRVGRIRDFLGWHSNGIAVVTCRALDYVEKLERLQGVEISPLDGKRIHTFLCNCLGETDGERLFWAMAGYELRNLWRTWQRAGGSWTGFWTSERVPENVRWRMSEGDIYKWNHLRQNPPPLLSLSRNPYLLLMTAFVYARARGELPANRARLLAAFVDALLGRERERHSDDWVEAERIQSGLAALAYAMQAEREQGTTIQRDWALEQLRRGVSDCDVERLLYLAINATLLDADDVSIRFYHQLLQEYFAAYELRQRIVAGEELSRYWPPDHWWEPSGWEETVILLAGMEKDASTLLEDLAEINPLVAARCLLDSGAWVSDTARCVVVEALIAALRNEDIVVRLSVAWESRRIGEPAVEPLIAALQDEGNSVRQWAAEALGRIGDARAVEPLIAALRDEGDSVRRWAARALGQIGDACAVEPLITTLRDGNSSVRERATGALGRIGDARAVEPLIAALRDENSSVRRRAIEALGQIGDARAVEPLIAALRDEDRWVRQWAPGALGQIGDPAVEPLIAVLRDEGDSARQWAAEALGWIGDARAVEPLIAALQSIDIWVRRAAAQALGWIGDACAVEPLIAALRDGNSSVRERATGALGQIGDARAVEPLIAALPDADRWVRRATIVTLGQISDTRAVEPLIAALGDADGDVRQLAAEALERIGTPEALTAFKQWRRQQ